MTAARTKHTLSAARKKQIVLVHTRLVGNCHCVLCCEAGVKFAGTISLFLMGQRSMNMLACPGKLPPLAPIGGQGGTRVGGFKTVNFRVFALLEEQQEEREQVAA